MGTCAWFQQRRNLSRRHERKNEENHRKKSRQTRLTLETYRQSDFNVQTPSQKTKREPQSIHHTHCTAKQTNKQTNKRKHSTTRMQRNITASARTQTTTNTSTIYFLKPNSTMINRRDAQRRRTSSTHTASFSKNIDTIYTYQEAYKDIMDDDLSLISSDHSTSVRNGIPNSVIGISFSYSTDADDGEDNDCHLKPRTLHHQQTEEPEPEEEQRIAAPVTPPISPGEMTRNTGRPCIIDSPPLCRCESPVHNRISAATFDAAMLASPYSYATTVSPGEGHVITRGQRARAHSDNMSVVTLPPSLRLVDDKPGKRRSHHHRSRNMALSGDEFWSKILKDV